MTQTQPWLRGLFGITRPISEAMWFDIQPISAGVFGVPLGFAVIILVSLFTKAPDEKTQALIEHVRYPHLKGDIDTRAT
jgi:cation/acetate symporter